MAVILSPQEQKIVEEILANLAKIKPNVIVGRATSFGNKSIFTWGEGSFTAKGSVTGEAIAVQDIKGDWYVVEGDSIPEQIQEKIAWSRRKKDRPRKAKTELSISINIGFTGLN